MLKHGASCDALAEQMLAEMTRLVPTSFHDIIPLSRVPYVRATPGLRNWHQPKGNRKGTNGVSTDGVTANFMSFDRGTFCVLPLTYFYLPKSARRTFFPNLSNSLLLLRPISVDPVCPQPSDDWRVGEAASGWGAQTTGECQPHDIYIYIYITTYIYIYIYSMEHMHIYI